MFLRWAATEGLYRVMSGCDPQAEDLWLEIMMVIELDRKSAMDLLLLAQSGVIGRASANKIMWTLMTDWALDRAHPNLSRRVTMAVRSARERFDQLRSGWTSDGYQWTWDTLRTVPHDLRYWSPTSVPGPDFGYWRVMVAFDGRPLEPPECWKRYPAPPAPPPGLPPDDAVEDHPLFVVRQSRPEQPTPQGPQAADAMAVEEVPQEAADVAMEAAEEPQAAVEGHPVPPDASQVPQAPQALMGGDPLPQTQAQATRIGPGETVFI